MDDKILIAYYSWSGNTDNIAGIIQQKTGGQLFRINPVNEYPADYGRCVEQAKKEIKKGFTPEIEPSPNDPGDFNTVFIGTPIWWYTMAPPVLTFLSETALSAERIVPFCSHGGSGKGRYVNDLSRLFADSVIHGELELYGDGGTAAENKISAWLKEIGIITCNEN